MDEKTIGNQNLEWSSSAKFLEIILNSVVLHENVDELRLRDWCLAVSETSNKDRNTFDGVSKNTVMVVEISLFEFHIEPLYLILLKKAIFSERIFLLVSMVYWKLLKTNEI
jgi:hypothetical protein